MKSAPGIDYVDISSGKHADDIVDGAALQETSSATADPGLPESPGTADPGLPESPGTAEPATSRADADTPVLISADVQAVMLGLWASSLRCVIVYALAPAFGPLGPLAVGTALVIQVAGTAVSLNGARSLWRRRYRGRHVYVLISILTCLCTLAALLAPAGF